MTIGFPRTGAGGAIALPGIRRRERSCCWQLSFQAVVDGGSLGPRRATTAFRRPVESVRPHAGLGTDGGEKERGKSISSPGAGTAAGAASRGPASHSLGEAGPTASPSLRQGARMPAHGPCVRTPPRRSGLTAGGGLLEDAGPFEASGRPTWGDALIGDEPDDRGAPTCRARGSRTGRRTTGSASSTRSPSRRTRALPVTPSRRSDVWAPPGPGRHAGRGKIPCQRCPGARTTRGIRPRRSL
jgi:hypothetical protein